MFPLLHSGGQGRDHRRRPVVLPQEHESEGAHANTPKCSFLCNVTLLCDAWLLLTPCRCTNCLLAILRLCIPTKLLVRTFSHHLVRTFSLPCPYVLPSGRHRGAVHLPARPRHSGHGQRRVRTDHYPRQSGKPCMQGGLFWNRGREGSFGTGGGIVLLEQGQWVIRSSSTM